MSLGQRETWFKMKTVGSIAENELKKVAFNFCFPLYISVRSHVTFRSSDVCTDN
jgi:hypothetical protein